MIVVLVCARLIVALPVAACAEPTGEQISSTATSRFAVKFDAGAIVGLKSPNDRNHTEFIQSGQRLGDVVLRYRQTGKPWQLIDSANLARSNSGTLSRTSDEAEYLAEYQVADGAVAVLDVEVRFVFQERDSLDARGPESYQPDA